MFTTQIGAISTTTVQGLTAAEIEATLNATDPVRKRSGKKAPEAPTGPSLFGDGGCE